VAVGTLPDGTPVFVSGSYDCTVRVWRLADGTPVEEPLRGHTGMVRRWRSGRASRRWALEEELVEPFIVDQVRVAVCDPGRPL